MYDRNTPDVFFSLRNLPATKSQPVSLLVSGEKVFESNIEGDVNASCHGFDRGFGQLVHVTMNIPVMGFKHERKFNLREGNHVTLAFSENGLQVVQNKGSFADP